jgi:hypothetical protein
MVCTNLNLYYIRKLSCKYELLWLSGSGEEDFWKTPPHFCIFVIISPLKRTWSLICTILNFLYLRMICTKFYWNWPAASGEDFSVNFYFFAIISPWGRGEGGVLHLYNSEYSLPKDDLCQLWLKLARRFWKRSWKCKSLTDRRQTDGQTDDGQKAIRKAHLSFQLWWAKKSIIMQTRGPWATSLTWVTLVHLER